MTQVVVPLEEFILKHLNSSEKKSGPFILDVAEGTDVYNDLAAWFS